MAALFQVDWHRLLIPSQPIPETILRGTATYLALFVLLRVFRRQTGSVGPADLLVLLLIADASQNAMAGEYRSITDGLILVLTIMAWEYALDFASFRFPALGKIIQRRPLLVIEKGKVHHRNLHSEFMTEDDLLSQLRQKGVDDITQVKKSFIEGDGHFSVITDDRSKPSSAAPQSPVVNT